ncbi:MAG: hypothetical protein JZU49_00110 [Sulfuricurvum sp.]|nr:hypothetical protein [Sulfuricurvum sp.]
MLDLLASRFNKVYCVFMYFVEGLEHQNPILLYPKRYPNTEVIQFPHWMISHYYRHSYYRFHRTEENSPVVNLGDIEEAARIKTGCSWVVNGAKQSDGLNRNLMLGTLKFNSINEKSKRIYPLALWKKAEIIAFMKHHRLSKPVEYTMNKSNGIDLKVDVLLFLRANFPNDYQKILKHFPFAEKLIFEYDYQSELSQTSEIRSETD